MAGELARMASKWRIDGVFSERGQVFTRVGLLVNLYSVSRLTESYIHRLTAFTWYVHAMIMHVHYSHLDFHSLVLKYLFFCGYSLNNLTASLVHYT